MNISVRFEGGLGDVLLANRLIPAIKEKYPDSKITAYLDVEGNELQGYVLKDFWPSFYEKIITIPNKQNESFWIKSRFRTENLISHIDNVPIDIRNEMMFGYDKFFDLHIDGLKWLHYDWPWKRYFYCFPPISQDFKRKLNLEEYYICLHLLGNGKDYRSLEMSYIFELVRQIKKFLLHPVILTEEKNRSFYNPVSDSATIVCDDIIEASCVIRDANFYLSIDSGLKFLAYSHNVPSLNFSPYCERPHIMHPSQKIRWHPFGELNLPMNYDIKYVIGLIDRMLKHSGYTIYPQMGDARLELL